MKINYKHLTEWVNTQLSSDDFESFTSAVQAMETYKQDTGIDLINVRFDGTREIRGAKATRNIISVIVNRRASSSYGLTSYQTITERDTYVEDMFSSFPSLVSEYAFSDGAIPANSSEMIIARTLREHGIGGKLMEDAVCEYMGWDQDGTIHGYDATFADSDRPIEIKSETATRKLGGAFNGKADWGAGSDKRTSQMRVDDYDKHNTYIVVVGRDPINGKTVYMFGCDWNKNRKHLVEAMCKSAPRLKANVWINCEIDPLYINVERMFDNYIARRNFKSTFAQFLINNVFKISDDLVDFFTKEFGIKKDKETPKNINSAALYNRTIN